MNDKSNLQIIQPKTDFIADKKWQSEFVVDYDLTLFSQPLYTLSLIDIILTGQEALTACRVNRFCY